MNCQTFGKKLITSEDLDPVYVMLYKAEMETKLLQRWLVAYWCFYDCGTASRIAESNNFWKACQQAYDEKWPRGSERRHFRGQQCLDSLADLQRYGSPEQIVTALTGFTEFHGLSNAIMAFRGFGPWITWKIADMIERVLRHPVDFSEASLMMYTEPVAGASLIYGRPGGTLSEAEMSQVVNKMEIEFAGMMAPPSYDRLLNIQEIETVLCKYKSHAKGHYHVGHDCEQIAKSLIRLDGVSKLATDLYSYVPNVELLGIYQGAGVEF